MAPSQRQPEPMDAVRSVAKAIDNDHIADEPIYQNPRLRGVPTIHLNDQGSSRDRQFSVQPHRSLTASCGKTPSTAVDESEWSLSLFQRRFCADVVLFTINP